MELPKAISAILFYQAEPTSVKRLAQLLKRTEGEVRDALLILKGNLENAGLRLVQNDDEVTLGTAPEASALIEAITKEELSRDLSKAALETLAIVLYKGPITRSEIDYIRGVNSTFILRNLLVRGLVEKVENPNDQRSFLYKATFQLLEYMGVSAIDELPDYHDAIVQLSAFVVTKQEEDRALVTTPEIKESTEETAELVSDMMEREESALEEEAAISEEDEAGGGFDDNELREHTDATRISDTP